MNVAFIPVRGGSKSIPLKNIRPICGRPLVYWTVSAACGCASIDKVFVATDSNAIKEAVEGFSLDKVEVIGRSAASASDTASTESAMLEFAAEKDFDNIALIQATSPLLQTADLDRGFALFREDGTDSVLSVVRQRRFCWERGKDGCVTASNYDVCQRPRRQEFDGYLVENGTFYITSRANLLKSKNRLSGRIKAVEMEEASYFEIDEPSDWLIVEALMRKRGKAEQGVSGLGGQGCGGLDLQEKAKNIRVFLTDCDGCLTDGGMYYTEAGDELKKFNTKDGMAFGALRKKGIITGIITGENVDLVRRRAAKLRLEEVHCGVQDKLAVINDICVKYGCTLANVAYVGDDINDTEALKAVGFGCSVADGQKEAKEAACYVTEKKGGEGAIREIVDQFFDG